MVNDREGVASFTALLELDYVVGGVCCKNSTQTKRAVSFALVEESSIVS